MKIYLHIAKYAGVKYEIFLLKMRCGRKLIRLLKMVMFCVIIASLICVQRQDISLYGNLKYYKNRSRLAGLDLRFRDYLVLHLLHCSFSVGLVLVLCQLGAGYGKYRDHLCSNMVGLV